MNSCITVKRVIGFFASILMASCSNYDVMMIRALQTYESKGAKVVTYCSPVTETDHFIIFEYENALYVNNLDKEKGTLLLMNANTEFKVRDYRPKIDNESYQIVLDTTTHEWQPISSILGSSLHYAEYSKTDNNYAFFIDAPNGHFLFDLHKPGRLDHYEASSIKQEGKTLVCIMEGDLREYEWEEPIPYLNYYTEPQKYRIVGKFDTDGNCLGFTNLYYNNRSVEDPVFIDDRLSDIRFWIDEHYQGIKNQEDESRFEHLKAKAAREAIRMKDIVSSFSYDDTESGYIGQFIAFYCQFNRCEWSDRPEYKYRLVNEYNSHTNVYLYSDDDRFADVTYPTDLYVFGELIRRDITGHGFWSVESNLIFEDGLFAGYY